VSEITRHPEGISTCKNDRSPFLDFPFPDPTKGAIIFNDFRVPVGKEKWLALPYNLQLRDQIVDTFDSPALVWPCLQLSPTLGNSFTFTPYIEQSIKLLKTGSNTNVFFDSAFSMIEHVFNLSLGFASSMSDTITEGPEGWAARDVIPEFYVNLVGDEQGMVTATFFAEDRTNSTVYSKVIGSESTSSFFGLNSETPNTDKNKLSVIHLDTSYGGTPGLKYDNNYDETMHFYSVTVRCSFSIIKGEYIDIKVGGFKNKITLNEMKTHLKSLGIVSNPDISASLVPFFKFISVNGIFYIGWILAAQTEV
jgi:hypothetical protein